MVLLDDAAEEIPLELDDDNNLTAPVLPGSVQASIEALLQHKDMGNAADLEAFKDELRETQWHAALPLENNGVKISPKRADWKCSKTGDVLADKTGPGTSASLWVNLSDGFIGGGRRNFDGSGGNNTALDHYAEMKAQGKHYPLAVKLGTITPDGADIYSYEEDDSVTMPKERLAELLARLGIDIMKMVKTEKDMQELQLELNMTHDFGRITGDGSGAVVKGPGYTVRLVSRPTCFISLHLRGILMRISPLDGSCAYTLWSLPAYVLVARLFVFVAQGMINMGNSCYMNSVCQSLIHLPEFKQRFADQAQAIYDATDGDPTQTLHTQFAKLAAGLHSGDYSKAGVPEGGTVACAGLADEDGVKPRALKALVGKGHPEFGGMKQQDAHEYFIYL